MLALACAALLPSLSRADDAQVLRYGIHLELATLDPVRTSNYYESMVSINLYDTLVFPSREKGAIAWIAKSWEISPDRMSYTFHLRNDVPFHDGRMIEAEDVAFSMRRALTIGGYLATFLQAADKDKVEVLDKSTVRFNLKTADPAFLNALYWLRIVNKTVIMNNKVAGTYGEFGDYGVAYLQTHSAGSGPFELKDRTTSDTLTLTRFDKYPFVTWKPNAPKAIRIQIIPEAVTQVTKLRAGELDVGPISLPRRVLTELDGDSKLVVERHPQSSPYYITINNMKPPLDDVHVRRAVAHAYDADTAMNKIMSGGTPLKGPVPPAILGTCADIASYDYNLDKAKAELAQSKYTPDQLKAFNMEMGAVATSENFKNVALMFSLSLKKLGLNMAVKPVRWAEIIQAQTKPETAFSFVLYFDSAQLGHPSQLLHYYTKAGWGDAYPGGGNYWSDPKVERLVAEGNAAPMRSATQNDDYCQASKIIAEQSASIFSHTDVRTLVHQKYVKGFKADAGAPFFDLRFENFEFDLSDKDYLAQHK